MNCPKCNTKMKPVRKPIGTLKGKPVYTVHKYRCPECGYEVSATR